MIPCLSSQKSVTLQAKSKLVVQQPAPEGAGRGPTERRQAFQKWSAAAVLRFQETKKLYTQRK